MAGKEKVLAFMEQSLNWNQDEVHEFIESRADMDRETFGDISNIAAAAGMFAMMAEGITDIQEIAYAMFRLGFLLAIGAFTEESVSLNDV